MSAPRIVVFDTGYDSYDYERQLFENAGYRFEIYRGDPFDREQKIAFCRNAVGLLIRSSRMNESLYDSIPTLKAIARYGVGHDNIDLEGAKRRNIKIANVQGYASHSVSDHALSLMYACARLLPTGVAHIHDKFAAPPGKPVIEFHDKTLGIVGLGRIGGCLSRKCQPLFTRILASDPYIPDERFREFGAEKSNLDAILQHSDVISLHCNLTKETTGLFDAAAFAKMQRQPIIINTARGPVLDEPALLKALNNGTVLRAGLDVFVKEPPDESNAELLMHPAVIATGHYGWYSETASAELQKRAADNLLALLNGEEIEDCLTGK
ncbi:hypothetical protein GF337_06735 [candidate division KSB1 bacterium]|nr:hypothetical protein [candidate division KSB1 bacterium]